MGSLTPASTIGVVAASDAFPPPTGQTAVMPERESKYLPHAAETFAERWEACFALQPTDFTREINLWAHRDAFKQALRIGLPRLPLRD